MNVPNRERRDWSLIIFIIPLGILLIIIVGQLAIRIFPNWTINADMRSNLDPNSAPGQPASLLQPILPQILTPMAWAESYLTPGAGGDISFPPFIVLEPTNTPSPTPVSPTPTTSPTTTPSPTSTFTITPSPTSGGGDDDDNNTSPPTTCEDPTASNYGGSLPCVFPPTTCQDNTATNFGGPLPCVYPPTTCEDPAATNYGGPLPCVYPTPTGYPSTPVGTFITPAPAQIDTDVPDGIITNLPNGNYTVLDFSSNPIYVLPIPDNNYDLVFYENTYAGNSNYIHLDNIIIGISEYADGSIYYEVFNWGDGIPDMNTNVGPIAGDEDDNQSIATSDLYDPDDAGPAPSTGILIDVDNASSQPPPNTYNYVVIISPNTGSGASQIDAVVVTEVPIPTP